ncbi:MAG: outer membrane protein assembly factor BamA [Candidatus Hydrogenedentes bacterium]|nr:outer membrane protein assembly factor BamA [Candidatus Hydrogenedentota bacterium]
MITPSRFFGGRPKTWRRAGQGIGLVILIAAACGPAFGQGNDGKPIKEVRIDGLQRVSEQLVRSQLEVQAGQAFNPLAISRDIRRLYDTTFFNSIKGDVAESGEGVVVTYIVDEKRVISEIKIIGNDKLKARTIRGALSWREGDTFVEEGYEEERSAVLKLYQSKGMPNASVDIVVEETGPSRVRITYQITEGKKAKISSLTFEGNDRLSDRKLKKGMETRRRWLFLGGKYDESKLESDLGKVIDKYGDVGRLEAEITGTEMTYSPNGKSVDIKVNVAEGPEYTVATVEPGNNTVYDSDEIVDITKTKAGEVHNRSQVVSDAQIIEKGYSDSGYINAQVEPQVTLDKDNKTTHVVQQISEGDLKYVKEITVTGNEVTRDDVVRREIFVNPGERFDGGLLEASNRRLETTEYYEAIRFSTQDVDDDPLHSNLLVDVDEGKTSFFNFGAGYNTDEGFGGYTELRFNNFDINNWPTFQGGGQQLRLKLALGQRRDEYSLSFSDPEIFGYPLLFGFDIFDESYDYEGGGTDYSQETQGARIRFGKVLSPYVTARASLGFQSVNYSDMNYGRFSPYYEYIGGDTTISTIWGINRTNLDSNRDPSKGARHDFQVEWAFGGDNEFWKFDHDSTWYFSLDEEKKWVFSARSRQGIGGAMGGSEHIPLSDRYFAGGSTTIRGYDARDVGPKEKEFFNLFGDDVAVGGELRLLNTLELKYKASKWFRTYLFMDSGGVWLEPGDFDPGDMRYSLGIGLGFDVPMMGPIRLDYGFPLNPDDDQGSGKFHLQGGFRF